MGDFLDRTSSSISQRLTPAQLDWGVTTLRSGSQPANLKKTRRTGLADSAIRVFVVVSLACVTRVRMYTDSMIFDEP